MGFLQLSNWGGPAIALAFLFVVALGLGLGVMIARWFYTRTNNVAKRRVSQDYFKGLNFVLNEQPDKAIEVFIKALEVDSETVELHLALGGLFRRKGQVDRATIIHQNLIARSDISEQQRYHGIHELAQDYYKAGWLDRAENLFLELKESASYRRDAINGLCSIYQQEKEWSKAIEVLKQHHRTERPKHSKQMAHYWCELAEDALSVGDIDTAQRYLRSAMTEDRSTARGLLLRGELHYQEQQYDQARKLWRKLAINQPALGELVVTKSILALQAIGDDDALRDYLLNEAPVPKDFQGLQLWYSSLTDLLGSSEAMAHAFERGKLQVKGDGLNTAFAQFLLDSAQQQDLDDNQQADLLKDLLAHAISRKIEYTCAGCGFDTKAMYWYCPNCGEWESFHQASYI